MKRVMIFLVVALVIVGLTGLAPASSWSHLNVPPGGLVDQEIDGSTGYGDVGSYIVSDVDNGANGVWHVSFIVDTEEVELYRHQVELVHERTSFDSEEINLGNATWWAHVNNNGTGSSDFYLTYPLP
jgi:hypothetical protein